MEFSRIFRQERIPYPLTYLNDLGTSIHMVNNSYCNWEARHITLQKSERVFAYELYHQFKTLTRNNPEYIDIRFDGEIGKQIYLQPDNCGTLINTNQLDYTPDFVLHKSQTDSTEWNQKLIVEIKARNVTDNDLSKDIIKLNHYISALNFQYSVFISVNTSEQIIQEKLKRIFSAQTVNRLEENFKRIIIVNYRNRILAIDRLFNLLIE